MIPDQVQSQSFLLRTPLPPPGYVFAIIDDELDAQAALHDLCGASHTGPEHRVLIFSREHGPDRVDSCGALHAALPRLRETAARLGISPHYARWYEHAVRSNFVLAAYATNPVAQAQLETILRANGGYMLRLFSDRHPPGWTETAGATLIPRPAAVPVAASV